MGFYIDINIFGEFLPLDWTMERETGNQGERWWVTCSKGLQAGLEPQLQ